jgi:hypothetical protein
MIFVRQSALVAVVKRGTNVICTIRELAKPIIAQSVILISQHGFINREERGANLFFLANTNTIQIENTNK